MLTSAREGARVGRVLVLLVLASRAAGGGYAACTEAINFGSYQTPGLAVAAFMVALAASVIGGVLVWRRQTVFAKVAVADAAAAVIVLLLLALALRPLDRMGSLNWALAYAVSCACWLALGPLRWWRTTLAGLLGGVYGTTALGHGAPAASVVTAVVNAVSPLMYFGIAAAIFYVLRRIAREIEAGHETERRQRGESARLQERERLFREMHQPVLAVLDAIASGALPGAELRARAGTEAAALRQAFGGSPRASGSASASASASVYADGLLARLLSVVKEHARDGWTVRLVDEEVTAEPRPAVSEALGAAVAALLEAATGTPGPGQVRIRIQCDDGGTDVIVRVTGCGELARAAIGQAGACLEGVGGTVSLAPALEGEHRVCLRVPA